MGKKPSSPPIIIIRNLNKEFGKKKALIKINLTLKEGDFLTIFGPNGAGKTTLIRIISTIISPTSGEIEINNKKLSQDPLEIRQQIGLVSHNPFLYGDLTAYENLLFYGEMFNLKRVKERADQLLKKVGLSHRKFDLVRTFSRGMLQRLSIARALLHNPSILLLDEPYTGLDPLATQIFDEIINSLKKERCHTFIMTSHDLEKGFLFSNRLAILVDGNLVFETDQKKISPENFKKIYWEKVKGDEIF